MKTVTCLTFIAIGAIFTFAVTAHPSFLNLQIAGLVVMATGVAGVVLPRRGQEGWLRRRMVLRTGARGPVVGHVEETRFPPTSCSTRERPAPRARRRIMRGRRPAAHEQEIPCVPLADQTILITGATDGLGQAVAATGARLRLHGRDDRKGADTARDIQHRTRNGQVHWYRADLSSLLETADLARRVTETAASWIR